MCVCQNTDLLLFFRMINSLFNTVAVDATEMTCRCECANEAPTFHSEDGAFQCFYVITSRRSDGILTCARGESRMVKVVLFDLIIPAVGHILPCTRAGDMKE